VTASSGVWLPVSYGVWNRPVIFALVDCNNFYASCERVFDPALCGRPVVVLSNNDGCIIARSQEAKDIGIAMGAPLFEVRALIRRYAVAVFSSNFPLYGDMSRRVMSALTHFSPEMEVYSIDEAFLNLSGIPGDITQYARDIRRTVGCWTGIPVSVGIGPTKTLAKLANNLAKKNPAMGGVTALLDPDHCREAMMVTPVKDIWGIGRRHGAMLEKNGIKTAYDLSTRPDVWVRKKMGIVGLRLVHEMRGISCFSLEGQPPDKKTTVVSRSFAREITARVDMESAIANFAERATEKLREGGLVAGAVTVFLHTNSFRKDQPQYRNAATLALDPATNHAGAVIHTALAGLKTIYRPRFAYKKAGVMMLSLSRIDSAQMSLLASDSRQASERMQAFDVINRRFGAGAIRHGVTIQSGNWCMNQQHRSPRYTTCWEELAKVQ